MTEHARAKQLKTRECLRLIADFCEPLRTMHASGIVHRDIKPSNLLVDEGGKPVLIDFGVVQDHGSEGSANSLTNRGQIMGTVACMSPEQARSDHDSVSPTSDAFSLGVVLHELLAHRHPFAEVGTPPMQKLRRIEECDVPDISEAATWSGSPVGTGDRIARAMATDAERRIGRPRRFGLHCSRHQERRTSRGRCLVVADWYRRPQFRPAELGWGRRASCWGRLSYCCSGGGWDESGGRSQICRTVSRAALGRPL